MDIFIFTTTTAPCSSNSSKNINSRSNKSFTKWNVCLNYVLTIIIFVTVSAGTAKHFHEALYLALFQNVSCGSRPWSNLTERRSVGRVSRARWGKSLCYGYPLPKVCMTKRMSTILFRPLFPVWYLYPNSVDIKTGYLSSNCTILMQCQWHGNTHRQLKIEEEQSRSTALQNG